MIPKEEATPASRLSEQALALVAARFKVLGEPARLRLLQELEAGERSVSELMRATGLTQTNVSRHLRTLADAGMLGRRKHGVSVYYHIADPMVFELCRLVCRSLQREREERARATGLFAG